MTKRSLRTQPVHGKVNGYKHLIIPSAFGGLTAWIFSGVLALALAVFAAVWIGNIIGAALHKK